MPNFCKLDQFGFLKLTGIDATKFLQGYTTCDLATLAQSRAQVGAICNLQGRMLTSFLVVQLDHDLILRMDRRLVNKTIEFLNNYIVFSKAAMQDISENFYCYGSLEDSDRVAYSATPGDGEVSITLENRNEFWTGAILKEETGREAFEVAELAAGIVWVTAQTSEQYLPQMFNYHNLGAIDFEKGCYLGQEIVARMQYRGELKRKLHRLITSTPRKIDESVVNSEGVSQGAVIASVAGTSLAVIQNQTDQSVDVAFSDGETAVAVPL